MTDSDKYVRAGHILHVYNVTRSDAGIYTCHSRQISPRMSHVDSFKINVTVLHPPQFTIANDSEHFGFVQGVANLSCSVDADPTANFTWYKDGQELRAKLIFEEKESDDYSWLLKTRQTLDRIVSQDSHSIALSLRVGDQVSDEGQHITGYAVLYKKGGDKSSLMHHFHKDGPFILTDLQPATVYVLQAASRNIAGMSPYSEQIVRRTDNLTTARVAAVSAASNGQLYHVLLLLAFYAKLR
ncbi:uncharacterized protein LOC108670037 [Hyalella azteca]|uniref:Uncharacterized protein LOC108670037 n=1 Tax=Hyalella azteca TaxID=294128 RepID=A0A8B7NHY7_HYAAZ|nr:uncharacterized protein LOC108670037 [Hyalella azteca]